MKQFKTQWILLAVLTTVSTASFATAPGVIEHQLISDLLGSWNGGDDLANTSAVDGNRAVIAVNSESELGARLELFEFNGTAWQHAYAINFDDPNKYHRISGQVLLQGNRLFVVAEINDNNQISAELVVFEQVAEVWQETAVITAPAGINDGQFGLFGFAYADDQVFVTVASAFGGIENAVVGYQWLNNAWQHTVTLQANNGQTDGFYAASVAYDGTYLVVGAAYMDGNDGAVFIYTEQNDVMTELQEINPPVSGLLAQFGSAVAVADGVLAISAPFESMNSTTTGTIYTYQLQQQTWVSADTILASAQNPSLRMGQRIWLEDNRIFSTGVVGKLLYVFTAGQGGWTEQVIARPAGELQNIDQALTFSVAGQRVLVTQFNSVETTYDAAVVVANTWSLGSGSWSVEGDLLLTTGAAFEQMGHNTAIHQNTALVSSDPITGHQQVFVYQLQGDYWTETQRLKPGGRAYKDTIITGNLALNDKFAAFSAYDLSGSQVASVVYVHEQSNGLWIPTELSLPTHPDVSIEYFGSHIALDGHRMAIAGSYFDVKLGYEVGQVLFYQYTGGQWQLHSVINQTFALDHKLFGYQVELAGDLLVVSSYDEYFDTSGRVDVFNFQANQWSWLTELTSPAVTDTEQFAKNTEVAADWVAVSAPRNDDMGYRTGAVYLYQLAGGVVDRFETVYANTPVSGAEFGASISLDKQRLLVGAPYEDASQPPFNPWVGSAYLYQIDDPAVNFISRYQASNTSVLSRTGFSVDLSGGYAITGVIGDDQNGFESGSALVFIEDLIFSDSLEND